MTPTPAAAIMAATARTESAMRTLTNTATYLDGIFAPVTDERDDLDLEVIGELPAGLDGMFVQNNPNPRQPPPGAYHWFDGDGMIHGVMLRDGRATYRNRAIDTRGTAAEAAAGRALWGGILDDFDPTTAGPHDKNTANTDLVWHGGRLLALWWLGGEPYEIAVPSLATRGPLDFGGTLDGGVAAHPKVDPVTGELVFFDYDVYRAPHLTYGVASQDGRVTHRTPIEIPGARLFHDIAITPNHTILLDLPMLWDPIKLAQGKRRVRFDRSLPARYGIIARHGDGSTVRWFEGPPCYIYHTVNAWEETTPAGHTRIVMTACRIEDPIPRVPHAEEPHIPRLYFLRMRPCFYRYTFDLGTGQMTEEQLDDRLTEFPRMNEDHLGRPTRYGYHQRLAAEPRLLFDGVIKYDGDRAAAAHDWGQGRFGGETAYVPRPGGTAEDDGWLTAFVTDRATGHSELHVLDAPTMQLAARVKLPRRVPIGFHTHWVPGAGIPRAEETAR